MIDTQFPSFVAMRRWDIYGPVHKGLRLAHTRFLTRLGSADARQRQPALLADLREHLALAASHLAHEEAFIHTALEGAHPGGTTVLAEDHCQHHERLEQLLDLIETLERADDESRPAYWRALYLAFTTFVAADLAHMAHEETVTWPLLCELFSDEQLAEIEMRIIGSLPPDEVIAFMRIMLPAMAPEERIGLLSGMKAGAPPEAYDAVISMAARPELSKDDFGQLVSLGLAA